MMAGASAEGLVREDNDGRTEGRAKCALYRTLDL